MFGHNDPRPREHLVDLQVHKVFYTIQGEGPFAGDPAVFIRLTGCNLKCWFCDTEWGDENDPYLSVEDVVDDAARKRGASCDLAVITGGEPTRQDLDKLLIGLRQHGFKRVQIETAGTFWQECLDYHFVTVVVSPKTAKVHPKFRDRKVHWKYVLKAGEIDDADGLPNQPMQRMKSGNSYGGGAPARPNAGDPVYLQPVDEHDGLKKENRNTQAMVESALKFGYRAGLQLHKHFEVE